MISAVQPKAEPSFTSVIPVRVFIDGLETFDEKLIKTSCRQLSTVLAGPTNKEPNLSLIRKFAHYDKQYNLERGYKGYPKKEHHKKVHPSEFFRCIIDRGRTFLFTGPHAEHLHTLGKAVGNEKQACKERHVQDSFDLLVAKRNYARTIANFINSAKLRIGEISDNGKKFDPITLFVNMKSNEKYGLSTFKIKLDSIIFEK